MLGAAWGARTAPLAAHCLRAGALLDAIELERGHLGALGPQPVGHPLQILGIFLELAPFHEVVHLRSLPYTNEGADF